MNMIPSEDWDVLRPRGGRISHHDALSHLNHPSLPGEALSRIPLLAAHIFQVPLSILSISDGRHLQTWTHGVKRIEEATASCLLAMLGNKRRPLVAGDAKEHPLLKSHPLITGSPGARFCAAAPLIRSDILLGSLWIMDLTPRKFSEMERTTLNDLAAVILDELECHDSAKRLALNLIQRRRSGLKRRFAKRTAELAQATAALKRAEEKYRSIFENAVDGIFQTTSDGFFLSANRAMSRMLGYDSPEELISSITSIDRQLYVDPKARAEWMRRMREEGTVTASEAQFYRKDGSTVWLALTSRTVRDESGGVFYFEGTVEDITAKKHAEKKLRSSYAELETTVRERTAELVGSNLELDAALRENTVLEAAIRSADVGVIITDPNQPGNPAIFVNPAVTRITGYPADEILGRNALLMQCPTAESLHSAIREHRPFQDRLHSRRKDGSLFWNDLTIDPVFDSEGSLINFVAIQNDVTVRVQAQQKLAESEARLQATMDTCLRAKEEAERANAAKNEFLSRMSHELRTPLNAILGFGQLLLRHPMDDRRGESAKYIVEAGQHLLMLVNEVLNFSSIESGQIPLSAEPVSLSTVLQESVNLLGPMAESWGVEVSLPTDQFAGRFVMADEHRLKQVFVNLLSNGIKYNREGGSLKINCRMLDDGRICTSFADTGIGISPEDMKRLFVPFERLSPEATNIEGVGIGLAFAQRLVKLMGGDIEVDSVSQVGSTFSVLLGSAQKPAAQTYYLPPTSRSISEQRTMLYVEDNLANLRLMEHIAEDYPGVRLISSTRGEEALSLAKAERPDMILLDLHLPDMKGDHVLRQFRSDPEFRESPIIMITADATRGQKERLIMDGASDYMTKPIDVEKLIHLFDLYLK